jgi:hypothetical protein
LVDDPGVRSEVLEAFEAYERALVTNDVPTLDLLFWNSPLTLRYGATENLVGYDAIREFRSARPAAGLARTVTERHVTTFGRDFAVANITFQRLGDDRIGRQSQTWVRAGAGWRVVAAHVSWMGG